MDKKQAQQLIDNLFSKAFDRDRYQHFLRNLLNNYELRDKHYTGNYIPDAFKQHIKQYWRIGKYVDPDGNELDLLVVEVKSLTKLERARSALRNFAVNRLKQFEKEASLIAFYAEDDGGEDWRFSFIKIDHEAYRNEKGKVKLKQELTPAKRYSYLVGVHENSHTACKQLLPLLEMDYADSRIEEIEAAFGIEKVSIEFFEQYKALFQKLSNYLKQQKYFQRQNEEETDQAVSRFAKKLQGQIVFLYFLQKKGWMGVPQGGRWGEGSKRFMRERYELTTKNGGNYYRDFLQYLFYEALAFERKDQTDPGYYARFECRVPFLNGGLFEADHDWQSEIIDLPNTLFHNNEKTKAGDVGTGILDVFDRYNFTIKEDEPLDKEVAVDPEMLGKVFENMLEITERKSKGAFYTPREIVHYMCQESLIHYLDNTLNSYATSYQNFDSSQTGLFGNEGRKGQLKLAEERQDIQVPKEDLEILIRKGHLALENDTRVLAKGKETDTYKFQLPESVRDHAGDIDAALADIKVCDPAIGSGAFPVGLLHEIVNTRLALSPHDGNGKSSYDLKRHAIAESIYGVDIDASAIDIARLRLWLSLIVDEDDYDTIEALPNLDYKIVRGDSLIGFPENWQSPAAEKIEALKAEFFAETGHDRKAKLKSQIDDEIRTRMAGSMNIFGCKIDFDFRLFFSEVWNQKGGFDVVIGNPPYGLLNKKQNQNYSVRVNVEHLDYFKNNEEFKPAKGGVINIFRLFITKSSRLLNKNGIFSEIFPLAYAGDVTSKNLREYVFNNFSTCSLEVFPERDDENRRVFKHAKMSVCILFFTQKNKSTTEFFIRTHHDKYVDESNEKVFINLTDLKEIDNNYSTIPIVSRYDFGILKKIYKNYKRISDFTNCYTGEIDLSLDKKYLRESDEFSVLLKGAIIGRYEIRSKMSQGEIMYLDANSYLKNNNGKRSLHHKFERIGMQGITGVNENIRLKMALIPQGAFLANSVNYLIMSKGEIQNKFVLCQLNSQLHNYIFKLSSTNSNVNGYEVNNLPIIVDHPKDTSFSVLIDYLQILKVNVRLLGSQLLLRYLDDLITALVYELYFPDEIKAANKDILPHLGELEPLTDTMREEEKLAIIQREFDRLYDPNHPVRNNLETLDSVDVVRTIREALKR